MRFATGPSPLAGNGRAKRARPPNANPSGNFFNVFGVRRRTVATFEEPVKKLSGDWGFIDLFWPGRPLVEHKSVGEDLGKAHAHYPTSTLADLYDPLTMPEPLLKAHRQLDRAVDRCYWPESFPSDRHRVEYLFALYEQPTAPLVAAAMQIRKARKTQTVS
jgi:hypothetical protein